jgi:Cytochrome c554 and c-prime
MILALLACAGVEPRLPAAAGRFAPSHLELLGDPEPLGELASCAGCHPDQAAAWQRSAHAHASFDNPWYRASVEALRDEVGPTASRHCAGCHDPVLLVTGAMDAPIDPAGVTCLTCHAAVDTRSDGNASLTLDLRALPDPRADLPAHRARMRGPPIETGAVCGTCHRGFLGPATGNPNHLVGMDELGAWRSSAWSGDDAAVLSPAPPRRASCVDCHFADHGAPGAHTALAAQVGGTEAIALRLRGAARVLVAGVWVGGRVVAPEEATGPVEAIDVVVWNVGTGHAFPGGTKDLQDTWVEVQAAASGSTWSGSAPLRAIVVDAAGSPERLHRTARLAAAAVDGTVPPGGARALRFVLPAPAPLETIDARLRHRRHPADFQDFACQATTPATLDGCVAGPEVEVDADRVSLGGGAPSYTRAYVHALALASELGEHTDDARQSITRALDLAGDAREQAAALAVLAAVESRQGRLAAALAAADAAEALVGDHPALDRIRAEARDRVWDFAGASVDYARAVSLAPTDVPSWRGLARARGSTGDPAGALRAAVAGLAFQPRDAELLRSQALALEALGDPHAELAFAAWEQFRPPDDLGDLQLACAADPECARHRRPVASVMLSTER